MSSTKFNDFVEIVKRLRKDCPWDKEQTNDSIKAATLEEVYELLDALDQKDDDEFKKELGDILFHIVFHSVIAEEDNKFNLDDVISSIQEKLIRRHPHVFGDIKVSGSEEIMKNWETIKLSEGRNSVLEGVPTKLPSLQQAYRIQEKAAKVGFDWEKKSDVWDKVLEEINEMREAEESEEKDKTNHKDHLEEEVGDVFFALINYARFLGINPELALRKTNKKFIKRFQYIESKLSENGKSVTDSNLEEMDKFWNESKANGF